MNSSPDFQGMRWLKCDLHMHTPSDSKCWRGKQMKNEPVSAADEYIRRCYEVGLKCIAITDHNFMSKGFIQGLRESISKLSTGFGYEIVLFPGFEITADVGKGIHVLAIFEPDTDLNEVDHILTNCGVPMPRMKNDGTQQPSTKRLPEIIEEVQKSDANGHLKGIVICPHPNETGIFDNDGISEWLQQFEWRNPELFAVEVPKPIGQMSQGWQKLFWNKDDCQSNWKRIRPIAALMSSDAKALSDKENPENYIGRRFSWIKMSNPSIEALRQAFLDPESRICLDHEPPPVVHTHVRNMHITGNRFLEKQTVMFSPHLNCVIGGRGSGKSLLFESLRLGLRGEMHFKDEDEKSHVAAKQIKRLRGTFANNTRIELDVFHAGLEDRFIVDDSGMPAQIDRRDVEDPPTVFRQLNPIIFSQEEITQLADRQKSLLDFIDSLAKDRLEQHWSKEREIKDRLNSVRQIDQTLNRIDGEIVTLKQEVTELGRQLEAKSQVQEELKRHRAAQEARRYLDSLNTNAMEIEEKLKGIAEELEAEPPPLGSRVETFPERDFFIKVEEKAVAAHRELAASLRSAVDMFRNKIELTLSKNPDWERVHAEIKKAEESFRAACNEKGLTLQEAERLRETELLHRAKQSALQAKQSDHENLEKQKPDMTRLLEELTDCWKKETEVRKGLLDDIVSSDTMPRTCNRDPILKTSLIFAGDRETFLEIWGRLAPDRRTAEGRDWDQYVLDAAKNKSNIGDQLFDAFQEHLTASGKREPVDSSNQSGAEEVKDKEGYKGEPVGNPIQWLELQMKAGGNLPPLVTHYLEKIKDIRERKADLWFELMLTRIPDAADLSLLRNDGTEAGSFKKGDLSTGQKNTAILSLLLARGDGPVLIDQPEDELDSEFLFRELVPMFRKAKVQRQLIIVTHNANIPVNADAELVYALKAMEGHGVCQSEGGLDRPKVTQAVLDIMEGSKEAFRRRKEKYHF